MTEYCTVLMTAGSESEAAALARSLVEARLAACCAVVSGVRSFYRWEGAIQDESEWMLVAKTRRDMFERLERHVRERHSYDVPEILCLPVEAGSEPYLQWLAGCLNDGGTE